MPRHVSVRVLYGRTKLFAIYAFVALLFVGYRYTYVRVLKTVRRISRNSSYIRDA